MFDRICKSFWVILACGLLLFSAGCSATGNGKTPTEDTTYLTLIPEETLMAFGKRIEISGNDYGQELTLYVGEIIQLNRVKDDHYPLAIDNQQVLQIIGNPRASIVILKAIAIGTARVTTELGFPCPSGPGCQPPKTFEYVSVNVVAPILQPTTYP